MLLTGLHVARFQLATTVTIPPPENPVGKPVLLGTLMLCKRRSHRWFYECCRAGYSLPSKRPRWPPVEVAGALTAPLSLLSGARDIATLFIHFGEQVSPSSPQLVGLPRHPEEVTGAAVGACHTRGLTVAGHYADGVRLAVVERHSSGQILRPGAA